MSAKRFTLDGLMSAVSKGVKLADAKALPSIGAGVSRAKSRKPDGESESQIQCRIMDWWRVMHRQFGVAEERLLMAFPLAGARTPRNGARMKREGLRAGTPDMFLSVSRGSRHGLWIELKKETGVASPEQKAALIALRAQGYEAYLCIGYGQAIAALTDYLTTKTT